MRSRGLAAPAVAIVPWVPFCWSVQRGHSAVPGLALLVLGLATWSVRRASRAAAGVIGPND